MPCHRRHSTVRARPFRTADAVCPEVVGSFRMLGQFTAQFAILGMPEHRSFRNLFFARLISALGTWTAFFAVRIALYNQTNSAWWVSILLFARARPRRHPRDRRGAADRPLAAQADDGPVGPRRRGLLRRAPVRPLPRRYLCRLRTGRASRPRSSAPRATRRSRTSSGKTPPSPRTPSCRGPRTSRRCSGRSIAGVGIVLLGPDTVYALNAVSFLISAFLLVRITSSFQSSLVARIGRTHWREVRAGLALVHDNQHLSSLFLIWSWATLAYAGHQRGRDRPHDGCVRRGQRRLRRSSSRSRPPAS